MQIEFDLTDYELENLKRKIDELDPVAQAEKVAEYIGKDYTQKQLGEKLSKTRDWVAKRVQFMRALDKLKGAERKEVKELVRNGAISMDVIILVADFPSKQRQTILSKHPTVSEARRLIDEYRQSQSSEAKLRVLEGQLSKAYIELEKMFANVFLSEVVTMHAICRKSISPSLSKKVEEFINDTWYQNYRFGLEVRIDPDRAMDDEMLQQRIAWLELPEKERILILQKTVADCQILCLDMVEELKTKARQVPGLVKALESLRIQLALMKELKPPRAGGFSLDLGNSIPPLKLDIKVEQFDVLYRTLAKAFHPDKHTENQDWFEEIMKSINVWHGQVKGKMKQG